MQHVVNTYQAEAWNGYEGRHWAENHERYDAVNEAMNEPLLTAAAITETDRVLDVGCGNGRTTRLAARAARRGRAVGVDLSAPMLARARQLAAAEGLTNVAFEQGDAQIHPFVAGSFDVAISRAAVMFFADPVAAFANITRALRPGGRLAFICPQDFGPTDEFVSALAPLWALMGWAGGGDSGAAALADPWRIHEVLGRARLCDIAVEPLELPLAFGRDAEDAAEFIFEMGPMRFNLRDADPAAVERARAEVTANLRARRDADGVRLRSAVWLVTARRPASPAAA